MKLFKCQNCRSAIYFDNDHCVQCGGRLGYLPQAASFLTVMNDDAWRTDSGETGFRLCSNAGLRVCNWLLPESDDTELCSACRHNHMIPDISRPENLENWRKVEQVKHHLFYTLHRLQLPLPTRAEDPQGGLTFNFLIEDETAPPDEKILTGHDNGVITLNLAEADDVVREQRRVAMNEPYRTLLGHFRHEIGHFYWDRLIATTDALEPCRASFGDERADYDAALKTYYARGPLPNWQDSFVSAYATAHPWEDFAETWAHYLHILDTLEMADAFGVTIERPVVSDPLETIQDQTTPYDTETIEQLIARWLPITLAVNSLNRCMGQADIYPFVLAPPVIAKLGFIHVLLRNLRSTQAQPLPVAAE